MQEYRTQQLDLLADGVRHNLDLAAVYAAMGLAPVSYTHLMTEPELNTRLQTITPPDEAARAAAHAHWAALAKPLGGLGSLCLLYTSRCV